MTEHPEFVALDGEIIPYDSARIHVLTAAVRFGVAVFEGIRAYWNPDREELYVFRLQDHIARLFESAHAIRMDLEARPDALAQSVISLVQANRFREDIQIRIHALLDAQGGGMAATGPVAVVVSASSGADYFQKGSVDVAVSSWTRVSDDAMPPRVKTITNYVNSRLALMQARADGYDTAILLTRGGKVAEGPAYNVFMLRHGELSTPSITDSCLEGITRTTLIRLAADQLDVHVVQRSIDRTELYSASELFFCGTAAEVTPIVSVDRQPIGDGRPGSLTGQLRTMYLAAARGVVPDRYGWLTPVYRKGIAEVATASAVKAVAGTPH